jgi:hypothetical protein
VRPAEVPQEGSAKANLFTELGKKAKPTNAPREPKPEPPAKPAEAATAKPAETPEPAAAAAAEPGAPVEAGKPAEGKDSKGRVSPWKLVDEYKGKLAAAEKEVAEARAAVMPEADRRKYDERIAKSEARQKELESHMAYVDYSKTDEFQTKFVAPYNKAWEKAIGELKEITVVDPASQTERAVTAQDMLDLVNLPLGKARAMANEVFGEFADDVMNHRKSIKDLFYAQQGALEDAKKNGVERVKQAQEENSRKATDMQRTVNETWEKENKAVLEDPTHGPLFKPREGDEVWNQRLSKGFELVDRAFKESPLDPKLTPEQRQAVIRRHAAVRNRAASWGAIRAENDSLKVKMTALEKELAEYKGSEPGTAGGKPGALGALAVGNAKDQMFGALRKIAK